MLHRQIYNTGIILQLICHKQFYTFADRKLYETFNLPVAIKPVLFNIPSQIRQQETQHFIPVDIKYSFEVKILPRALCNGEITIGELLL